MTTFGHRVIAAVKEAKQNNPGITVDGCAEIINQLLAAEKPVKAKRQKPLIAMTEEEFIASMESDPALRGVDVKKEIGRCQFWCRVNDKQASRKRIVNWLMRADKTVGFDGAGKTSFAPRANGIPPEPKNWKQRLDADFPGNQINSTWEHFYKQHPDIAKRYL